MHYSKAISLVAAIFIFQLNAEELPELEILITTKMKSSPEHIASYLAILRRDAASAFGHLSPVVLKTDPPPQDGTARYRLSIEHSGTVTVGTQLTESRTSTGGQATGGGHYKIWSLEARQQGTLNYKFVKWEDGKYTELEKWTVPVPPSEQEIQQKGVIEVARMPVFVNAAKDKDPGCPIKIEEARVAATMALMPGKTRTALLDHLITVIVGKTADAAKAEVKKPEAKKPETKKNEPGNSNPPGPTFDLTITNKTPWPLKMLEVNILHQGRVVTAGVGNDARTVLQLPEPLAPGAKASVNVPFREIKDNRKPGVNYAEFEPAAPGQN